MAYSDLMRSFERRRAEIMALRRKGWSQYRIATKYGISRARVGQILKAKPQ
jgi:transcriptional regulator